MNMTSVTAFAAALLAGTVGAASAQTPPPPPPPEAMTSAMPYVMAAGQSDQYEIQSSQVAVQKTRNPAVRRFASMLIQHHQKTTAATMKAATRAGLTPPPPPPLDPGAMASITELQNASAEDFDRLYIGQQIPAHQAALNLHQGYASGGDKAPLKTSAKAAVPIIRQHIAAATKLHGGKGMTGMSHD